MSTKVKIAIALVAGLLLAVAPAAALPDPETETFTYDDAVQHTTTVSATTNYQSHPSGFAITFNDIAAWSSISNFVVINGQYWSADSSSGSAPCTYLVGSTKLGTGTVNFNKNYNPDGSYKNLIVWFTFNGDWDVGKLGGRQSVSCSYDSAQISGLRFGTANWAHEYVAPCGSQDVYITSGGNVYRQDTIANVVFHWRNEITVSPIDSLSSNVDINRRSCKSYVSIYVAGVEYYSATDTVDQSVLVSGSPISVTVNGPNGKTWTRKFLAPLPAPDDSSEFSLSLSSPEATNYAPVTATLTAAEGAPEWDEVAWIHGDEQRTFSRSADGWKEFNYDTLEYDIESDEHTAHNYQFEAYCPPGVDDPEDLVICCLYSQGKQIAELTGRVEIVSGSSKTQLAVVVVDYSGGQTPVLFGADVTVKDQITKQLQTESGSDDTFHRFVVEKGRRYTVSAEADGYHPSSREITASRDMQTVEIYLSQNASVSVPENSTQVDFLVKDPQNNGVEGALISLTDSQTSQTQTGLTNSFGTRTFVVAKGHLYQYTVSKTGYVGMRGTVDPSIPGTRTIVICSEDAWPGAPDQPVSPGSGPDPDHHEMARQTLNEASKFAPQFFTFAFLMLFLCVMRRGGK